MCFNIYSLFMLFYSLVCIILVKGLSLSYSGVYLCRFFFGLKFEYLMEIILLFFFFLLFLLSLSPSLCLYLFLSPPPSLSLPIGECVDGSIRLADGSDEYEGRIEVCLFERWGTVCDHSWSTPHAEVVCRQLGLPTNGKNTCTCG